MTNIVVQSDAENNIVGKSSNQARGSFIVLENTNHGSYIVIKLDNLSASKNKSMTEGIYLLPPCISPYNPIDSTDLRFVSSVLLPIIHPLKKYLNIETYNEI